MSIPPFPVLFPGLMFITQIYHRSYRVPCHTLLLLTTIQVHPIFEFTPDQGTINEVMGRMSQNRLYFMYGRALQLYQDAANVTEQVNAFKKWSNLLVWYTGDEPDESSDPTQRHLDRGVQPHLRP